MNLFNLLVLGYAFAASTPRAKTLKLDFNKVAADRQTKRSDEVVLNHKDWYYSTTVKLGSEKTEINVVLDTGSSDAWVTSAVFPFSSTMKNTTEDFSISYGDGTNAQGFLAYDTLELGDATITDLTFGYATQATSIVNFYWGIGFTALGIGAYWDGSTVVGSYDNIPQLLKKQGYISEVAYSLWMDNFNSATGSILFGGVDHTKYEGTLGKVPIIPVAENVGGNLGLIHPTTPRRFMVMLNEISATNSKGESGTIISGANIPVMLDTGTTYTMLPNEWVTTIAASLGAVWRDDLGGYIVPKESTPGKPSGSINYNFSGVEIKVPFESFVRQAVSNGYYQYWDTALEFPMWKLGLSNGNSAGSGDGVHVGDGTLYILGDTFLSGAYIVYDLDNLEVALAPAKTGTITEENVEAITNGIPSATQAPHYSSTQTNSAYSATTLTIF